MKTANIIHKFFQMNVYIKNKNVIGPISIKNVDIDKILVSNKVPFDKKGFKYFIGCKDAKKIKPLFIFLPRMTSHRKDFDETKYISFFFFNKR